MVAHAFNSGTWEAERQVDLFELKASLVYLVSFRSSKAMQRPCLIQICQLKNTPVVEETKGNECHYCVLEW